jgi:hypothetical protein
MNDDNDIKPLSATRDTPDVTHVESNAEIKTNLVVNKNGRIADSLSTFVIAAVVGFFSYMAADISATNKIENLRLDNAQVKVLNIPEVAEQWSDLETKQLQFAITELVNGYTDSGYLVIDSKYALGDVPDQYLINIADIDVVKAELAKLMEEGGL